jgi:NTP pyrophosphatase (non-canonical NTP hydrolase)
VIRFRMQDLMDRVARFRDECDWVQFHGLEDEALSLLVDAGELAECFRWHDDATLRSRIRAEPRPVADELADVRHWLPLIAHDTGIDLREAFERKMIGNARKYPVDVARGSSAKYGR